MSGLLTGSRPLLLVIPVAALLGIGSALAFSSAFDQSNSQGPDFRLGLARQNHAGAVANHSPRRVEHPVVTRRTVRKRHVSVARAPRAAATAAVAIPASGTTGPSSTGIPISTGAPVNSTPAPTPAPAPLRIAPAPRPKPTTTKPSSGGSFDDSG